MLRIEVKEVNFQIRKKMFLFAQIERDSQVKHKNTFVFKIDPAVITLLAWKDYKRSTSLSRSFLKIAQIWPCLVSYSTS